LLIVLCSKMRFGPEAVKLQFDHVRRFRIQCAVFFATFKNPANINIFTQIAPFRRTPAAAPGNIDGNGSLPYKPRQLSAMTRSDRGGSIWAGKGPLLGQPASPDLPH
jgi:hypothetical protein